MVDAPGPSGEFPTARVRRDFPALEARADGAPLVYLDNAATTQKPERPTPLWPHRPLRLPLLPAPGP